MIVFILVAVIGLVLLVISAVFGIFGDDIEVAPEVEGGGPCGLSDGVWDGGGDRPIL
jgi:hypothetical protein